MKTDNRLAFGGFDVPLSAARGVISVVLIALFSLSSGCATKRGIRSSIDLTKGNEKHFVYPLTESQASAIAYAALAPEAGSSVQKASGYGIGYTGRIYGGLEWADLLVTAVPVRFVDSSGNGSEAFAFEVGFTGSSIIVGPNRSSKVLQRMIHDASLIAKPIELTSAQIAQGRLNSLGGASNSGTSGGKSFPPNVPKGSGTGFFVTDDGYLLTNFHVVDDASVVKIRYMGEVIPAKVVKTDQANDLALLKVTGKIKPLNILKSSDVKLGDSIFTIGFPNPRMQGQEPKLTDGRISSLSGLHDNSSRFQVSVPVQPGNSGGPLVNSDGNVVGIIVARLSDKAAIQTTGMIPQNVNYAIKSSYALLLLDGFNAVSSKLKPASAPNQLKFEEAVEKAKQATVMVEVY